MRRERRKRRKRKGRKMTLWMGQSSYRAILI